MQFVTLAIFALSGLVAAVPGKTTTALAPEGYGGKTTTSKATTIKTTTLKTTTLKTTTLKTTSTKKSSSSCSLSAVTSKSTGTSTYSM
jgi:hypothetical protein